MLLIIAIITIALAALFLYHLQVLFETIPKESREISPWMVWLNLIPVFNLGWMVYTVLMVDKSVKNYLKSSAGYHLGHSKEIGLGFSILWIVSMVPQLTIPFSFISFVLWAYYWYLTHRLRFNIDYIRLETSH